VGCRLADHGTGRLPVKPCSEQEAAAVFTKVRGGKELSAGEISGFQTVVLHELNVMNAQRGWAQQLHLGALRNINRRMLRAAGPAAGFDAMGDFETALPLARFLDALASREKLARTIVYNINPRDNELIPTILAAFQDDTCPGKMQFGPAWWFNDQKDGIRRHLEALSAMGLLARFVGMVTDSRSLLSFTRHDYFRRILCTLFGGDMERGELPEDYRHLGGIVQDICYGNAVSYFNMGA
jgi:glucuronate isomerase